MLKTYLGWRRWHALTNSGNSRWFLRKFKKLSDCNNDQKSDFHMEHVEIWFPNEEVVTHFFEGFKFCCHLTSFFEKISLKSHPHRKFVKWLHLKLVIAWLTLTGIQIPCIMLKTYLGRRRWYSLTVNKLAQLRRVARRMKAMWHFRSRPTKYPASCWRRSSAGMPWRILVISVAF